MSDNSELKRLAEALLASDDHADFPGWMAASDAFDNATGPAAVLAMIGENDALSSLLKRFVDSEHEQDENQAERHMYFTEAQSLLALVSGELEAHTIVPDSAIKAAHSERDQLRAEVAGLRTGYEAYEQVNADLKAEIEELRKDADRYRWLRNDMNDVAITFGVHSWEDLSGEFMDSAIDAAMSQGEKP